jgi:hypothetical protein
MMVDFLCGLALWLIPLVAIGGSHLIDRRLQHSVRNGTGPSGETTR